MSWDDYNAGRQNPNQQPGSGPINWDFQQGQFDAYKELQDKLFKPAAGMPSGSGASAPVVTGPPARPLPKSLVAAAVLPLLLGPLGLFYGSWKGALIVIGVLMTATMMTENLAIIGPLLVGSYVVSFVWSIAAVATYNRTR
jgi:hypothetical protein